VQSSEVLQRHDDDAIARAARAHDQVSLLVHADHAAIRLADPVVEAEAAVARRAGDEGLPGVVPLRRVEQRDEVLVAGQAAGVDAKQLTEHRRDVHRAAVDPDLPMPDARDALGEQQLRAARAELLLQRAIPQQESHALDEQAGIHALLGEVAGTGGIGVADGGQVVATRQHQDWHELAAGLLADLPAGLDPGELRHHHVEHDTVGLYRGKLLHGFLAVRRRMHEESRARERSLGEHQVRRIVVGDQDGRHLGGLVHGSCVPQPVPVPRRVSASSAATSAA